MPFTKRSFFSVVMVVLALCCVAGFASSPEASADPAGMAPPGTHVYACDDGTTLTVTAGSSPVMALTYVSSSNGSGSMTWSAATGRYTEVGGWMRFAVGGDGKWHVFFLKGHYTEGAELVD